VTPTSRQQGHIFVKTAFASGRLKLPAWHRFIGAVGLTYVKFEAFTPGVEVAWGLNRQYWGQGYAIEAAQAAIADGFNRIGLEEIVSMTGLPNIPFMKVMERLSMTRAVEFDHPHHPETDPLRRHVLYRLRRAPTISC
jgi:RimJ/RimL family protein N-acetyltransferase